MSTASIVICTRDRAEWLGICIASIVEQWPGNLWLLELLIVDNGSTDDTRRVVEEQARQDARIQYLSENEPGLSRARNRGVAAAVGTWIGFIDDDARLRPGYLDLAGRRLAGAYAAFGGMYYAWYAAGDRPRWISAAFGTKRPPRNDAGLLEKGMLSGGNMWIRKDYWRMAGGFRPELGMHPSGPAYGEDDAIQLAIRKRGGTIFFDPALAIDHLVLPYKLKLGWHLRRSAAKGRADFRLTDNGRLRYGPLLRVPFLTFRQLVVGLVKWLTWPNFYLPNLFISTLHPLLYQWGKLDARRRSAKGD